MSRVFQTQDARDDLDEIWLFIARDDVARADRFIDEIESLFQRVADHPEIGRIRLDLGPAVRSFPLRGGNYVIYYRIVENGVEVLRVLHVARSLRSIFQA